MFSDMQQKVHSDQLSWEAAGSAKQKQMNKPSLQQPQKLRNKDSTQEKKKISIKETPGGQLHNRYTEKHKHFYLGQ